MTGWGGAVLYRWEDAGWSRLRQASRRLGTRGLLWVEMPLSARDGSSWLASRQRLFLGMVEDRPVVLWVDVTREKGLCWSPRWIWDDEGPHDAVLMLRDRLPIS